MCTPTERCNHNLHVPDLLRTVSLKKSIIKSMEARISLAIPNFIPLLHLLTSYRKIMRLISVNDYVHSSVANQTLNQSIIKILSLFGFIVTFN